MSELIVNVSGDETETITNKLTVELNENKSINLDDGNNYVDHTDTSVPACSETETVIYEMAIHNMPKYKNHKELKKYLISIGLKPRRVQINSDHAYVAFVDEMDLQDAVKSVHGQSWKGKILRAKRATINSCGGGEAKRMALDESGATTDLTADSDWSRSAAPLAYLPYEEQLRLKQADSYKLLKKISWQIKSVCDAQPGEGRHHFGDLATIKPSPVTDGYRNKCEFTIGWGLEPDRMEIGFAVNRYRHLGRTVIVPVDDCKLVPDPVKCVIKYFRVEVLPKCCRQPCNGSTGFWRSITAKFFKLDFMLIVAVNPKDVSLDEMKAIKNTLVEAFFDTTSCMSRPQFRVTSLYLSLMEFPSDTPKFEKLAGVPFMYETVLNNRFRISPSTFFQTNTAGCYVLYDVIRSYIQRIKNESKQVKFPTDEENSSDSKQRPKTLLFDLCCGCGSISICVADIVDQVVGVELNEDAVEDAKINARCNEKKNCQFLSGKAEETFMDIQRQRLINFDDFDVVVAVLDPPRKGLGDKIISSIRQCDQITHVVYVSCDAKGASKNFQDLSRRPSKRYRGLPFELKSTTPVDLFPHTSHFEWVMLFERGNLF